MIHRRNDCTDAVAHAAVVKPAAPMTNRSFNDEGGFTLIETVAAVLLLALMTAVAFGLIQSTDRLMWAGSNRVEIDQTVRSASERLKQMMHSGEVPTGCVNPANLGEGDPPKTAMEINPDFAINYTCLSHQQGIDDLHLFTVTVARASKPNDILAKHAFYATKGGY